MEYKIKEALQENEKLLWQGRPGDFEPLDTVHKSKYIRRIVICIVVVAALMVSFVVLSNKGMFDLKIWLVVLTVVVGVYMAYLPFQDCRKLKKDIIYLATDKRLVVIRTGNTRGVAYESILQAKLSEDEAGKVSLLCGKRALKSKAAERRLATITGATVDEETNICDEFVMYAIDDVEAFKAAVKGQLSL